MAAASLNEQYEQLMIEFEEEKISFTTPSSPGSTLQVVFNFCCEPCFTEWVVPLGSSTLQPQNRQTTVLPPFETSVLVSSLDDETKASEILGKGLQEWAVQPERREELVDIALDKAREVVIKYQQQHNNYSVVHLNFRVKVSHILVRNAIVVDDDEVCKSMVPAAESSIESLEKKKLTEEEDYYCCVCLEEIVCRGEEAAMLSMMPCQHGFHEDCINEWLRTSHYCPVCRF